MRVCLVLAIVGGTAHAAPLVLHPGEVAATFTARLDTIEAAASAADVWVGATPQLTVGTIHSSASIDRIGAGPGVNGIDVLWSACDGALAIAPRGRAIVRDGWSAATLGALARWSRGRFAIAVDPYVRVGLSDRDRNRDGVIAPVWVAMRTTDRIAVAVHTGYGRDLGATSDAWHVPLGLDATVRVTTSLEVGVEAGFTSLVAPRDAAVQQSIAIAASWHQP